MSEKKSRKLPWKGTAVPAAICALLLTLCLLGAGFGLLAVQVTTSQELHERGALAEEAVAAQIAAQGGDRQTVLLHMRTEITATRRVHRIDAHLAVDDIHLNAVRTQFTSLHDAVINRNPEGIDHYTDQKL